ncbi:MAG: hypothetical protein AB1646_11180 [Thermodesulfobacteriota bacterium]
MAKVPSKYGFVKYLWPVFVWPIGAYAWARFVVLIAPQGLTQNEKAFAAVLGLVGILSMASMVAWIPYIFRAYARQRGYVLIVKGSVHPPTEEDEPQRHRESREQR